MHRSSLLAAAAGLFAAPALAGTLFTAKLAEPVDGRTDFIANKAVWVCEGETCTAELSRKSPTVRTCKEVSEEIGVLASFESEKGALDADDLAECNTKAKQ